MKVYKTYIFYVEKCLKNLHFLCRKMFERFISNQKHVLAFFSLKNNKISQNLDTDYHYIKYGGGPPFPSVVRLLDFS